MWVDVNFTKGDVMTPLKFKVHCPRCEIRVAINDFYVVANGDVIFDLVCPSCHNGLIFKTTFVDLLRAAFSADTETEEVESSPLPEDEKPYDDAVFLKAAGISIPSEQLLLPAPENIE